MKSPKFESEQPNSVEKPLDRTLPDEDDIPTELEDGIPAELKELLELIEDSQIKPSDIDFDGEIGTIEAIPEPDVDISLTSSRQTPVAGELWSVSGTIRNRSITPVWIVDKSTTLTLAPEMYGQTSSTGSMGAFFPTIGSRPFSEVVRIDPGASYSVVWKIDPMTSKGKPGAAATLVSRISNSLRNYMFFNPGKFKALATTHIWTTPPIFDEKGNVKNFGASFVQSAEQEIAMASSPWVLIFGAAVGATLCFILQFLFGNQVVEGGLVEVSRDVLVGFLSTIILAGVSTVLLSRLSSADFILVVKVEDIWGGIATGFAIQWLGFPFLERLLANTIN